MTKYDKKAAFATAFLFIRATMTYLVLYCQYGKLFDTIRHNDILSRKINTYVTKQQARFIFSHQHTKGKSVIYVLCA